HGRRGLLRQVAVGPARDAGAVLVGGAGDEHPVLQVVPHGQVLDRDAPACGDDAVAAGELAVEDDAVSVLAADGHVVSAHVQRVRVRARGDQDDPAVRDQVPGVRQGGVGWNPDDVLLRVGDGCRGAAGQTEHGESRRGERGGSRRSANHYSRLSNVPVASVGVASRRRRTSSSPAPMLSSSRAVAPSAHGTAAPVTASGIGAYPASSVGRSALPGSAEFSPEAGVTKLMRPVRGSASESRASSPPRSAAVSGYVLPSTMTFLGNSTVY